MNKNSLILSEPLISYGNSTQFIDAKDFNYLSEVLDYYKADDFPDNVILNKTITGAGMTSCILAAKRKYVLCVPFINLITNKETWCDERGIEYLSIYSEGSSVEDIIDSKVTKIMVTYDSLYKVTDALKKRGDILEWKLAVDECHKLVDSAAFRPNAISSVLSSYKEYGAYLFGTATPVRDRYQLPALRDIPKVQVTWNNILPVTINYLNVEDSSSLQKTIAAICIDFLTGKTSGNAHIFINSVNLILSVINHLQSFNDNDFTIVCSINDKNVYMINNFGKNRRKNYEILRPNIKIKKINFYTSTAFEGCDIYDEEGVTFIVSDGNRDHTKIDILSTLPQIAGRIRNSKYKNNINLIYSSNSYFSFISEESYERHVKLSIEKNKDIVDTYKSKKGNEYAESTLKALKEGTKENPYIMENSDGDLVMNENAFYSEMNNYSTIHSTYYVNRNNPKKSGIKEGTIKSNDINYTYKSLEQIHISEVKKFKMAIKPKFDRLCEEYSALSEKEKSNIDSTYPIIKEAYSVLGFKKVKALEFRKSEIEKELMKANLKKSVEWKICKYLNLTIGKVYSKKELKEKLQEAYNSLGIKQTAKTTDLSKWYYIEDKNIRNKETGAVETKIVIHNCFIKLK